MKILVVNPDKKKVLQFRDILIANKGFCPSKEHYIEDNRCPCKDMLIKNECICNLFIAKEV